MNSNSAKSGPPPWLVYAARRLYQALRQMVLQEPDSRLNAVEALKMAELGPCVRCGRALCDITDIMPARVCIACDYVSLKAPAGKAARGETKKPAAAIKPPPPPPPPPKK